MSEGITLHIEPNFTWRDGTVPEVNICDVPYKGLTLVKASAITVLLLTQNYTGSADESGSVPQNFMTAPLFVDPQCCQATGRVPLPANGVPFIRVVGKPCEIESYPFDVQPVHTDRGFE